MTTADVASDYARRGWSPVPIPAKSKRPTAKGWEKLRLAESVIARHFRGTCNVGVLLGEPSKWLVDVDLDHALAVELADQFLPATGAEFGRAGKPRSHRLYAVTAPVETVKRQANGRKMIAELRSGGCQTVFPGSVHPSGERIEWSAHGEPAKVPPGLLLSAFNALANEVERRLSSTPKPAANIAASGDVVDRARKYLAKIPPAVSGQGGHATAFHAACCLVQGFALERDIALTLLAEWNDSCVPPWTKKELDHKVDDALKLCGERGYLLNGHGKPRQRSTCSVPTEALGPILTCLADVEPRAVSWLWKGRIPLGRITLLVGRPGEGKSFFTTDAAARVTTGTPWPDGRDCPQGSVILISAEDDPADTIRPRLDAHYAEVRRVHLLSAVRRVDDDGQHERLITLADVDAIEAALAKLTDCRLIVVDPIGSFLGGRTDAHRDNEVRGVLAPIAMLAEKYGPAVLVVAHRRKSAGSIADDLALGSRAFTGIARAVWHLTRDGNNKARRLLLPGKNNLAREGDGLAFSIIGEPARISWEREPVAMSADDALAAESQSREQKPGPQAEALEAACAWLTAALAGGPRLAKELLDEWKNGQGGSERTLKRAKQSMRVEAYRVEVPGPWWWQLTCKDAEPPDVDQLGPLGILAETTAKLPGFDADDSKGGKLPESGIVGGERVRVTL